MSSGGGQVLVRRWKSGRGYALRFHAYGKRRYLTLGLERDGWTKPRAEEELANVLADVRRGRWSVPNRRGHRSDNDQATDAVRFGDFAARWLTGRAGEVAERTLEHEAWALEYHLLPFFADGRLEDIDIAAVDAYRRQRVEMSEQRRAAIDRGRPLLDRQGRPLRPLAPVTINKTIDVLQAILAMAVEYGDIPSNPATGRRRRLKPPPRRPVHLDSVDQITALLDAAARLDGDPDSKIRDRYPQVATLLFAGPRAHEHSFLRWRDIDLANGRIHIGRSKTQAGLRDITLLPILHAALSAHRGNSNGIDPENPVFPTRAGTVRDKDNVRNRVLGPVLKLADDLLIGRGQRPLPAGLSPHKLRHTFASILVACGEDPASVMAQLGHTDPNFTLRIYTHMMRRDPEECARLKALVHTPRPSTAAPPTDR